MSDAEDATNEVNDDLDNEQNDYDEAVTLPPNVVDASPSTTTVSSAIESSSSAIGDEYDDEPLEDYVVKLIVNGEPDSSTSAKDLIQAGITDTIGNLPSKTSDVIDAINGYTSTVFDELAGSTTAITGEGKRFFNWSTRTWLIIGLIALCIIGLILALIFCFLGKKLGKNKRTQTTGTTSTTKAVVTKGIVGDQRYEQLPKV